MKRLLWSVVLVGISASYVGGQENRPTPPPGGTPAPGASSDSTTASPGSNAATGNGNSEAAGRRGANEEGGTRGGRGARGRGGARGGGRNGAPQAPAVVVPPGKPTIVLWPNGAPGSEAKKDEPETIRGETIVNVHNPAIIVFLPTKETNTGVGIIVAPGGGHTSLWIMHEGFNAAQALADRGIAAFVLKNRLESSGYKFDVEGLADMQRAIKVVRSRAAEWGINPAKIGASGFSAGGELAELVAIRNDAGNPNSADPVERFSSRPDFQALIYPGKSPLIQPTENSPPAFMAAGFNDREDISVGLAEAYLRFKKAKVQAELHIYANVGHGFGLRPQNAWQSHQEWPNHLVSFLKQAKFITTSP